MDTRHLLVPVDFSDASIKAIESAASLLSQLGGSATLVHVLSVSRLHVVEGELEQPHPETADLEAAVHEHLDRVRETRFAGIGGVKTALIRSNSPADAVCQLASDLDASMIIISSHGRGRLERFLVGSVTEKVVRHAPCTVLVVR